jgi:hypothetical protein
VLLAEKTEVESDTTRLSDSHLRHILLPLDRPRRLRRDVVRHPVDPAHFVDDAVGDPPQERVLERVVIGRHPVGRGDSP